MTQEICPFCKSAVNDGAEVCHSCGARKGYGAAGKGQHQDGFLSLTLVVLSALFLALANPSFKPCLAALQLSVHF